MSADDSVHNLERVDSSLNTPQDDVDVENNNKEILAEAEHAPATPPVLPTLPSQDLDLEIDLSAILGPTEDGVEKIKKRQSNVLKLSEENEKLKAQLKAMTDRIEAAERRREELAKRAHQRDGSLATAVGAK